MKIGRTLDRVIGSSVVTSPWRALTRNRLRILAYHGVHDVAAFAAHLHHLDRHYRIVDQREAMAVISGRTIPDRAVWITFDDGDPSVVEHALPLLEHFGFASTMFVCPGVIDTHEPYWWEVVAGAAEHGLIDDPAGALRRLKTIDDTLRRAEVAGLRRGLADRGVETARRQLSTEQLHDYVRRGGTVGNHTWDHPCLDTCTEDEQRRQILQSHEWLVGVGIDAKTFAYPNGNSTNFSASVLGAVGYSAGLLFDHRLAGLDRSEFAVSRLRVNDHTTPTRLRSIVAGVHPMIHRVRTGVALRR